MDIDPGAPLAAPSPGGTVRAAYAALRRDPIMSEARKRRNAHGLALLGADFAVYIGCVLIAISPLPLPLCLFASIWAGLFTGAIFVIGHDACHQSLTSSRFLNPWIGRLAFLPSAHAMSLWVLGHNQIHHRFTNLKGRDYVWEPMSLDEYRRAPLLRRWVYRLYRGPLGAFPYYLVEMWWKKNFLPIAPEARRHWRRHVFDSAFILLAQAALIAAIAWGGSLLAPDRPLWATLGLGWLLPFLVWNGLMGLVIYAHHTHPEIAWFEDPSVWKRFNTSVAGTVHARLPQPLHALSNNIMEHNAHHADPSIPLYSLRPLQGRMRSSFPGIPFLQLTPASYLRTLSCCKLFDFTQNRWVDFAGVATGPRLRADQAAQHETGI
jgi:acyl-lipid omega-6 desaturase (Delta-12 desaturase)